MQSTMTAPKGQPRRRSSHLAAIAASVALACGLCVCASAYQPAQAAVLDVDFDINPLVTEADGSTEVSIAACIQQLCDQQAAAEAEAEAEAAAAEKAAKAAEEAKKPCNIAVKWAKKKVGCAYVYGADGPKSFDCSGLVKYVYAKAGISLPHNAQAQYNATKTISKSKIKVGDLVFFGSSPTGIYHVGIYIGNGKFVHASTPTDGVLIEKLSDYSDFVGATRVSSSNK